MPSWIWIQNVVFPILGMGMATFFGWHILKLIGRQLERRADRLPGGDAAALKAELDTVRRQLAGVDDLRDRLAEVEERLDFTERVLARSKSQQLPGVDG